MEIRKSIEMHATVEYMHKIMVNTSYNMGKRDLPDIHAIVWGLWAYISGKS